MIKKTITLYTFSELSEEVQRRLIDKNRYDYGNDIYDIVSNEYLDDRKAELENIADNVKIYYSGFCSQGDGACIIGNNFDLKRIINLNEFCEKNKISRKRMDIILKHITFNLVKIDYHYSHCCTVSSDVDTDRYITDRLYNFVEKLEKALKDWQERTANKYYHKLKEIYDYYYSDEYIKEDLENDGDTLYTEDGLVIDF